jgi:hypothetical protein
MARDYLLIYERLVDSRARTRPSRLAQMVKKRPEPAVRVNGEAAALARPFDREPETAS